MRYLTFAIQDVCITAGQCPSRTRLPSDIQAGIDSVRQGQLLQLPLATVQPEARYVQLHHQAQGSVLEASAYNAATEVDRYTILCWICIPFCLFFCLCPKPFC